MTEYRQLKGYTLIELVVVMAILGILIATVSVGMREVSRSSRNAQRRADMDQVKVAVEMYRSDKGELPPEATSQTGWTALNNALEDYLSSPIIPARTIATSGYDYMFKTTAAFSSCSAANAYELCAQLEPASPITRHCVCGK